MSIHDKQKDGARAKAISKTAQRSSRTNPSLNLPGSRSGYSGETVIRKTRDGSVRHGIKYNNDWYYRKYTKFDDDDFDITELIGVEKIQSSIFKSSLYSGKGFQIAKNDTGHFTLEIDNIIARKSMRIWELIINRLRAHNGTIIVGSSAKVESYKENTYNNYTLKFENESSNAPSQPFKVGDVIASKRTWFNRAYSDDNQQSQNAIDMLKSGAEATQVIATVDLIGVDGDATKITVTLDMDNTYGNMNEGLDFVRVASSDTKRQGLVVISSDGNEQSNEDDSGVPFIDVYGGLATYANFLSALSGDPTYVKVRIGKLDALTGNTDEYGMWANVIHLVGAGVEGANNVLVGTLSERNAYDVTLLRDNDVWIVTDQQNNVFTWDSVGEDRTSGTLVIGTKYTITNYVGGDFIVAGATTNVTGEVFECTYVIPVWGGSTVTSYWIDRVDEQIAVNTGWITHVDDDGYATSAEKETLLRIWKAIVNEYPNIISEASIFGTSSTAYTTAYDALDLYLNTTLVNIFSGVGLFKKDIGIIKHWSYPVDISGSPDWDTTWNAYYTARQALIEAIQQDVDDRVFTDENGRLYKAPTTGVAGLFAGSTHLGYHNGSGVWNWYGDNTGQFYCKGALGTALWWKPADTALYIGGTTTGSAYLKAIASNASIGFYDDNNVNVMNLGSNLIGSFGGIDLKNNGLIYMNSSNNNAISNIHLQKYNQSGAGVQGLQTLYLSNEASPSVTVNPTNSWIVSKIEGERNSNNNLYGIYSLVSNGSAGNTGRAYGIYSQSSAYSGNSYGIAVLAQNGIGVAYGVFGRADGTGTINYGIYGKATRASTNWAGYFADGNVNINNTLYFGSGNDTNLYRDSVNVLKTDNALYVVGNITTDGTVDGVDIASFKTAYDSHSHAYSGSPTYFSLYKNTDLTIPTTATNLFNFHVEDYDIGSNCVNGIFTAPANGYYHFDTSVTIAGLEDDASYYRIYIVANGKTYSTYEAVVHYASDETQYHTLNLNIDTYMASASTAQVYVVRGGGTSGAVVKSGRANTTFSGHRFA